MPAITHLEQGHETLELAQRALDLSGTLMCFSGGFNIKGIPGQSVPTLKDFSNPFDVPDQNHIFQVLATDVEKNAINKGDNFSIFLQNLRFDFCVRVPGLQDATGWARLEADYLRKDTVNV